MKYEKIVFGSFIDRPNRFIAHVEIDGKVETVHVKNTGRCKELLIPGCTVIMEDFRNCQGVARKTLFDLIAVYKKDLLINMDSQAPNKAVFQWLLNQANIQNIKPEFTFGQSRLDFFFQRHYPSGDTPCLMEVKGVTLERDGVGYFPDAPTARGVKHLLELSNAVNQGYECYLAFVIQIPNVKEVRPNVETDPDFGDALNKAKQAGVHILFLQCDVKPDEMKIVTKF